LSAQEKQRRNTDLTVRSKSVLLSNTDNYDFWSAVRRQRRVLFALLLRNVRTKFFGHGLGYLIAVAWPLSHILIIVLIYTVVGRAAPFGDSIALFIATGVVPFQTFSYLSRFMMLSIIKNRPLLAFPEVKILDVLFAAAALETLAACLVAILFIVIAWACDIDVMPRDVVQASYAFGAAILLGVGFGMFNSVMTLVTHTWFVSYSLSMIILWATAGILFVPDSLPVLFREILSYHPVLQLVEWMRSAYYEGYGALLLDRGYVINVALGALFLGLLCERALRGHLLAKK
jgi:capsular polysaccharide transport system permease protein